MYPQPRRTTLRRTVGSFLASGTAGAVLVAACLVSGAAAATPPVRTTSVDVAATTNAVPVAVPVAYSSAPAPAMATDPAPTGNDVNPKGCKAIEKFFNFLLGSFLGFTGAVVGGPAGILTAGAGLMVTMWFVGKCLLLDRPQPVTTLTIAFLMDEMEKVAGARMDQALVASVENRTGDLLQTIEIEKDNLEHVDELTLVERERLSMVMQTLGNNASLLESEFKSLPWQSLPAIAFVGALKMGAYGLSYALTEDGRYRRNLETRLIPAEREDTIELLAAKEADLVRFVRNDLTTVRVSSKRTSGGAVPTTWFDITADASRSGVSLYHREWECERRWAPRKECTNFESRRTEYFTAALNKYKELRTGVVEILSPEYLAIRNELMMYRGADFFLTNNRVGDNTQLRPGQGKCLDVPGAEALSPGAVLQLWDCESHLDLATDQAWRFVPGSGQVRNVRQGLCLDVEGSPDVQADGSPVVLAECAADDGAPSTADQHWGYSPDGIPGEPCDRPLPRPGRDRDDCQRGAGPGVAVPIRAQCRHRRFAGHPGARSIDRCQGRRRGHRPDLDAVVPGRDPAGGAAGGASRRGLRCNAVRHRRLGDRGTGQRSGDGRRVDQRRRLRRRATERHDSESTGARDCGHRGHRRRGRRRCALHARRRVLQ